MKFARRKAANKYEQIDSFEYLRRLFLETDYGLFNKNKYFQSDYYVALASRDGSKVSFNIWAAIFGPSWCFYRKLYALGLAYIAIYFIVSIALMLFFRESSTRLVIIGSVVLFRLGLGLFANGIYIAKSLKRIDEIVKAEGQENAASKLAEAGGVSGLALAIYIIAGIGVNLLLTFSGI